MSLIVITLVLTARYSGNSGNYSNSGNYNYSNNYSLVLIPYARKFLRYVYFAVNQSIILNFTDNLE